MHTSATSTPGSATHLSELDAVMWTL